MSVLEIIHEFETGDSFAVTDYGSENGSGREALPWQRWAEDNRNRSEELMTLLKGLSGAVIRPVEGDPMACEVVMRCRAGKTNRATIGVNLGVFDENKRWDAEERYVGFRSELFGGLETDVELHLTDREGHRVGIDPDVDIFVRKGRKDLGEMYSELWLSIRIPLTVPRSEIAGGHIALKVFMPRDYDRVEVDLRHGEALPKKGRFGNTEFAIEKIDSVGLVVSVGDPDGFDGVEYLYLKDGRWYSSLSRSSFRGEVPLLMKLRGEGHISFEEWLDRKGIDLRDLPGTMYGLLPADFLEEESRSPWGNRINTGMWGERFVMCRVQEPERQRVVGAFEVPYDSARGAEGEFDVDLCRELLEQLEHDPYCDSIECLDPDVE